MKQLDEMYGLAIGTLTRSERAFTPVFPAGWDEVDTPRAMLVVVGGWVMESGEWNAYGLILPEGRHLIGHTHPGSAFPKAPGRPKLFEGTQCEIEVGGEVNIVRDLSTNGTLVIPAEYARCHPELRINDALSELFAGPCPRSVAHHDVILTLYAELALVIL
jgi:hypothetical protein